VIVQGGTVAHCVVLLKIGILSAHVSLWEKTNPSMANLVALSSTTLTLFSLSLRFGVGVSEKGQPWMDRDSERDGGDAGGARRCMVYCTGALLLLSGTPGFFTVLRCFFLQRGEGKSGSVSIRERKGSSATNSRASGYRSVGLSSSSVYAEAGRVAVAVRVQDQINPSPPPPLPPLIIIKGRGTTRGRRK
jgi:hypothetical protein